MDALVEPIGFAEIVADIVEPIVRRSIKYRIKTDAAVTTMMDYVFADNPIDAEEKARAFLGLEDDAVVEVARIWETSGITGAMMQGIKMAGEK